MSKRLSSKYPLILRAIICSLKVQHCYWCIHRHVCSSWCKAGNIARYVHHAFNDHNDYSCFLFQILVEKLLEDEIPSEESEENISCSYCKYSVKKCDLVVSNSILTDSTGPDPIINHPIVLTGPLQCVPEVAWLVVHAERVRLSDKRHDTCRTIDALEALSALRISLQSMRCVGQDWLLHTTLSGKSHEWRFMTRAHQSLAAIHAMRQVPSQSCHVAVYEQGVGLCRCVVEPRRFNASHARMYRGQRRLHVQSVRPRWLWITCSTRQPLAQWLPWW